MTLAATRRGRAGESGRGERLLALVQLGDQQLGLLVGLEEVLDTAPDNTAWIVASLEALAGGLDELAVGVLDEDEAVIAKLELAEAASAFERARCSGICGASEAVAVAFVRGPCVGRELVYRRPTRSEIATLPEAPIDPVPSIGERIREAVAPDAFAWRHAVRVGIVVALR